MEESRDMGVDHRVVKQFRVEERKVQGRCHIDIKTLGGTIIDQFEGWTEEEVSRRMHAAGYQPLPPGMADALDLMQHAHYYTLCHR